MVLFNHMFQLLHFECISYNQTKHMHLICAVHDILIADYFHNLMHLHKSARNDVTSEDDCLTVTYIPEG